VVTVVNLLDSLRERVAAARGDTPFTDPSADERRRWVAAGEVSDGPASRIHTARWLARSRRCHAHAEGALDALDAVEAGWST
jgi:hypothetical protein